MQREEFFKYAAPERFGFVDSALKDFFEPTRFPEYVVKACGLHYLLAEASTYERTGRTPFDPGEMMHKLKGDCQDQSVLLASMYLAGGLEVRFIRVDSPVGELHVLPEVYCPVSDPDLIADVLTEFYSRELGVGIGDVAWEKEAGRDGFWLIADPIFSEYVGDLSDLEHDGYVEFFGGNGDWEWVELFDVHRG
ncbi:hypothetical protein [Haloarcula litorea]|uniref:hypothetical protein n=1 Tax=Haloarcula litorea TaxID=3032579 RepID=UPI0023E80561|nr:hypothetical protein [Halomicroarcula sp. GDY20]